MNMTIILALLPLLFAPQDAKQKQDDVIQLKESAGGGIKVGQITQVDKIGIQLRIRGRSKPISISWSSILPYSVYQIKVARIQEGDAASHWDLAEYCRKHSLYSFAVREYREAMKIDPSREESAMGKIQETRNEDARTKYEEARRLALLKKWKEASHLLTTIIMKYSDTPYFDAAKKEVENLTADIESDNEKKKAQLGKKKQDKKENAANVKEDQQKRLLAKCVDGVTLAKKSFGEGLDWEGKDNLTRAEKAWKKGEGLLLTTRRTAAVLLQSNDIDIIKRAKEIHDQATALLVRIYYHHGAMWATQLNFREGKLYLNHALQLPHDTQMDHLINETLLTLNQIQMRQRAAGKGY